MFLGIEIGGTKLQLGVGPGDGSFLALERRVIDRAAGADAIRRHIEEMGRKLVAKNSCDAIGIGFGGPVDVDKGVTIKSHHVAGWDGFPLVDWSRQTLGLPTAIENDAETAGLAEACLGAGRGANPMLYVTVGTGIGGGLIVDGSIYRGCGLGAAEIGHLRPGLEANAPGICVESKAAGWGIEAVARARVSTCADQPDAADLRERSSGDIEQLTTRIIADAANAGNRLACEVLAQAADYLGWAIAQTITLMAPEVVVVGGGVSLIGNALFFEPLREVVARYVFPPFAEAYRIEPAACGEEVVVHGALLVAKRSVEGPA